MAMNRVAEWRKFSEQEEKHIIEYTEPQYLSEDKKTDQVNCWTAEECATAMKRYLNRFGSNLRGPKEALRDMLKVAHYAQFAYNKIKEELEEGDVY